MANQGLVDVYRKRSTRERLEWINRKQGDQTCACAVYKKQLGNKKEALLKIQHMMIKITGKLNKN